MTLATFYSMRKQLIVFSVCLLLSGLVFYVFYSMWQSSSEQKQTANNLLQNAKSRYYTALDKKRIVDTFENKYLSLIKNGIFGEENRLDWIDAIEATANKHQISLLKYRIDKQQLIKDNKLTQKYPGIDVFSSIMHLEMQLLHEADLYRIINHMSEISTGLFDVQSCAITRNLSSNKSIIQSTTDRNFSAACTLNWYTMKKKVFRPDQSSYRRGAR